MKNVTPVAPLPRYSISLSPAEFFVFPELKIIKNDKVSV
jgi:hypothetical protein